MKYLKKGTLFALFFLVITPAFLLGQSSDAMFDDIETETTFTSRFDHQSTQYAMTNTQESVDLMIVEDGIAIQFADTFFDNFDDEIRESETEESAFEIAFKAAVSSGISSLLDRAMVIPYHEIAEAYYDGERLYIFNHEQEDIFENLDMNDEPIMESFSSRKAKRFATLLNRKFP